MENDTHRFIVTVRHLIYTEMWFVQHEFTGTDADCVEYMKKKDPKNYKVIKGNWCELQYEVSTDNKKEIPNKHSQGSVSSEQQDIENTV